MSKILEEIEAKCEETQDYTLYNCFIEYIYKTIIYSIMASNNTEKFVKDLSEDSFYKQFIFDYGFFDELNYVISYFSANKLFGEKYKEALLTLINIYRFSDGANIAYCNELIRTINSASGENVEQFIIEEATRRFRVPFKDGKYAVDCACLHKSMKCDLVFLNALVVDDEEFVDDSSLHDDYKVISLFAILDDIDDLSDIETFNIFADKILKKYSLNIRRFINYCDVNFWGEAKKLRKYLKGKRKRNNKDSN